MRAGCTGVVALGSLGEGGSLSFDEKKAVLRLCREALAGRASLVAGVAAMTTADAVRLAELGADAGLRGPHGPAAVRLPRRLARDPRALRRGDRRDAAPLHALQQPDRVRDRRASRAGARPGRLPPQPRGGQGVERGRAPRHGAARAARRPAGRSWWGWTTSSWRACRPAPWAGSPGSPTRCPRSRSGSSISPGRAKVAEARALYDWFLPLLRLDTVPKFVQLIKLVQQETGLGSETVRPPRLPLEGAEREAVVELVRHALARRPPLG